MCYFVYVNMPIRAKLKSIMHKNLEKVAYVPDVNQLNFVFVVFSNDFYLFAATFIYS